MTDNPAAPGARRTRRPSERRARRSAPTLSLEAIIAAAIEILDKEGLDALTLRRLSSVLGVGVASLYWHIDDKDDLLDQCAASILRPVIARYRERAIDPDRWRAQITDLSTAQYDLVRDHPWLPLATSEAANQITPSGAHLAIIAAWDRTGALLLAAGLSPLEAFHATTAISNHLIGMGASASRAAAAQRAGADRAEVLRQTSEHMLALAARSNETMPYLIATAPVLADHDEREQFLGALNLILDGVEQRVRHD